MEAEEETKETKEAKEPAKRGPVKRESLKRDSQKRSSVKRDNMTGEKRRSGGSLAGYEAKYPVSTALSRQPGPTVCPYCDERGVRRFSKAEKAEVYPRTIPGHKHTHVQYCGE